MSLYKNGIISAKEFYETDGANLANWYSYGYTPGTGNNSTHSFAIIKFDDKSWITTSTVFRIVCDVSYSGFDESNTDGTFNMYFQGARYEDSTGTWVWEGENPFPKALNDIQSLTTLVLSSESGFYRYNTTLTLTNTWLSTYSGQEIGIRTNYSNGTGRININKLLIIEDKYSSNTSAKAHIGEDFMSGYEIIEI